MIKEANLEVGVFVKTRGVKGDLILKSDIDLNEDIEKTELIFIELDGLLVPFLVAENGVEYQNFDSLYIRLADIPDSEEAKKLLNKKVFFCKKDITTGTVVPKETVVGFSVHTVDGVLIGTVSEVIEIPGNPLLSVMDAKNEEQLLPFNDDLIVEYSIENKTLTVELPQGILDLE